MTNVSLRQPNSYLGKHSRVPFYIGMALMIFAVFARNILGYPLPVFVILAIGALVAVLSDQDEIIALVISCVPMSAAFQYKYLIFICIIVYIVKFGKNIKYTSAVIPLYLMVVWELIHGLFYPFSIYECLRGFSELLFCAFLTMVMPKKVDYKLICRLLAISSICMMSIVLLNLLDRTGYNFEAIFVGRYRFGVGNTEAENFGVNYNANQLGLIANLSIAGLLQIVVSKKHSLFDYLMIVVLTMYGVMTMSRTFLVCFALIVSMFAISGVPTVSSKIKRIIIIFLMITLLFFLVYTFMPDVYRIFADRFQVEDISNGRNELFAFYTKHIMSSPLYTFFGVGMQDYASTINSIHMTKMNTCHNGVQELILCWGLPGLLLFAWFIVELLRNKPKGVTRSITNFIPLVLVLVAIQAGQLITSGTALLALSLAYTSLCNNFGRGDNYEQNLKND